MNDLINDLDKLYELNAISFSLEPKTFQDFQNIISPMIKEKEEIIKSFEKQAELGEDWEYERGGEQTLYDDVPTHIIELNNKLKGVA